MPAEADSVVLDGQTLLVEGFRAIGSVSEFTSGLKIGRATQDDRQHAFYNDFDDFSGGFGEHQLDIREALGTHWDNAGGVDLRRRRHMTLPPKKYVVTASAEPSNMILSSEILANAAVGVPRIDPNPSNELDYFYYGAGDSIYRMATDRNDLTRVVKLVTGSAGAGEFQIDGSAPSGAQPQTIQRLFLFRGSDKTQRLYALTADPGTAGPTSLFVWTADPGVTTPTWNKGDRFLWDAIPVPAASGGGHVVIAQEATFRIMQSFLPIGTTDLSDWNIDDSNPDINGALWLPNGIVRFLGAALAPWAGTSPAVYFIDLGDGKLYALNPTAAFAEAIDIGNYHYLLNGIIWQGFVAVTDGFDVWLYSPGGGGQETVRRIPLYGKDGIPPSMRTGRFRITGLVDGGDQLFAIAEYLGSDGKSTTIGYVILVYNGAGWSLYYPEVTQLQSSSSTASNPMTALIDRHPVGIHVAQEIQITTSRTLAILTQADPNTGLKVEVHSFRLPAMGKIPIDGIDEFENVVGTGHAFLTGWLNGGFTGLNGALFHLIVDLQTAERAGSAGSYTITDPNVGGNIKGVTVKVEYRLDDDENGAFTTLGTARLTGRTTLEFDSSNKAGVEFRTVQFKVTFDRDGPLLSAAISGTGSGTFNIDSTQGWLSTGVVQIDNEVMDYSSITSTSFTIAANGNRGIRGTTAATHLDNAPVYNLTRTAELRGITLVYAKKPPFRQSWLFTVDIDKMVEQGSTGTGWTGAATHQKVWDFLKTTWNKKPLVKLIGNEREPTANNLRVEIVNINDLTDDFRHGTPVTKGRATITVIEPVRVPDSNP